MNQKPSEIIFERMAKYGTKEAICYDNLSLSYIQFLKKVDNWIVILENKKIKKGSIVSILGDFNPESCALTFALIKTSCIIVPLTDDVAHEISYFKEIGEVQFTFDLRKPEDWVFYIENDVRVKNDLTLNFLKKSDPGLIVFTSGSTGKPKGILHNLEAVLNKFIEPRKAWRTVLFLLMDHFGGLNTFLSSFAYGGVAICPKSRTTEGIASAISQHKANLLPTTPTFLNLLYMGHYSENNNFSSIELITYGTEMMTDITLQNTLRIFPNAKLKQTYGMSEIGVLRSKSESDDSLWLKVGGGGFDIKVKEGILWVKSEANMVGYLNASQPFDKEGWMNTGDEVEQRGEYIRFKGRKSDVINIGGKKVFPAEVENVILQADNVRDVSVFGKKHPLMGEIVCAKIIPNIFEEKREFINRLRLHCNNNLAKYKVPVKFEVLDASDTQHSKRFKKMRK